MNKFIDRIDNHLEDKNLTYQYHFYQYVKSRVNEIISLENEESIQSGIDIKNEINRRINKICAILTGINMN